MRRLLRDFADHGGTVVLRVTCSTRCRPALTTSSSSPTVPWWPTFAYPSSDQGSFTMVHAVARVEVLFAGMVIDAFLHAAECAEVVVNRPEVADRWPEPSVLDGHSIGSLAAHLTRAVFTVQRYLDAPAGVGESTVAAGYLVTVLGDADPIDSDLHRSVRERANDDAAAGHADLCARFARARQDLAVTLPSSDLQQQIAVLDGVVLPLEEYLRSRIVELVVHLDDLYLSIGSQPPDDLGDAFDIAACVLAQVAVRRTGPWETLRSLARRERHPAALRAL
jgi:hypothetical protein